MQRSKYNHHCNRKIGYLKIAWTQRINSPSVMEICRTMKIVGCRRLKLLHQVDRIVAYGWGRNSFSRHTIHRAGKFKFLMCQKFTQNLTAENSLLTVRHFSISIAKPSKLASIFQPIVRLDRIPCQCHQLHLDAESFPCSLNPVQPVCDLDSFIPKCHNQCQWFSFNFFFQLSISNRLY